MLSILKATALLGSSSVMSLLVGLISVKVWATFIGPAGLGQLGLLQGLLNLAATLAGFGTGAAIVRFGARSLADGDHTGFAAYRQAAWWIFAALGSLILVAMTIFQVPIAGWMLGGAEHGPQVMLIGVAVMFTFAAGLETGTLNAHHLVGVLARLMLLNTLAGAAVSMSLIWAFGTAGIAPAMLAGAVINWAIARHMARRKAPVQGPPPSATEVRRAAGELLRFGLPYTGSGLVGSAVQALVQLMVLHRLDLPAVGFHRAAVTLSERYLGVILTAMGQDYYPRLSATERKPAPLSAAINMQFRLVLLIGGPLVLGLIAAAGLLVPLIYTEHFTPVVGIVEWQIAGNLFRFTSWTMAYAILAHGSGRLYFCVELAGALATLGANWIAITLWGLEGLGMAFLAVFAAYFALTWAVLHARFGFALSSENQLLLAAFVTAAGGVLLMPAIGLAALKLPTTIALSLAAAAFSAATLWRAARGLPHAKLADGT